MLRIKKQRLTAPSNSLSSIISQRRYPALTSSTVSSENTSSTPPDPKPQSKVINPKRISFRWSKKETDKFFNCLEIFGMDFSMFATLLFNRTQGQILAKYHNEKKRSPLLVEQALRTHELSLFTEEQQQKVIDQILNKDSNKKNSIVDEFSDIADEKSLCDFNPDIDGSLKGLSEMCDQSLILPLEYYLND